MRECMCLPLRAPFFSKMKRQTTNTIPIKGIALGNGWIDATVQGPMVIDYAWWHALIDLCTKEALQAQFQACWKHGIVGEAPFHSFNTPDECGTLGSGPSGGWKWCATRIDGTQYLRCHHVG